MDLDLTQLTRQPMHRQIASQIRTRILSESFPELAELPPVRDLARSQRVSVAAVERAYRDLEEQGLVEQSGHEVFRVTRLSEDHRRELARRRLFDRLRNQELSLSEIELARDIQCRLLPPPRVEGPGFVVVSRSEPASFMTGDFHDVIPFADGTVGVFVADVAGKGMGASLIMASVKAMLPFVAGRVPVEQTLVELNRRLCRDLGRREFVAMAWARFDPTSNEISVANAGLPDPWLLSSRAKPRSVEVAGERLPLGIRERVRYEAVTTTLLPGERLVFVTDGIPEASTGAGEPLGYQRWASLLAESSMNGSWNQVDRWLDSVVERFEELVDSEPSDDRTILAIENLAGRGEDDPSRAPL